VDPKGEASAEKAYAAAAEAVSAKVEPSVDEPIAAPIPTVELPPRARRVQKAAPAKSVAPQTTIRRAKPRPRVSPKTSVAPQPKEIIMEKTPDFAEGAQKAAQKGSAMLGEYAEFAKGNFEAIIESGRILTTGLRGMGSAIAAEGKTAIETMTADAKELASVKSPGELLKLQADILRRNLDSALTLGTKNGQTAMQIASESFAPISARVALAVEKLKQVA
jgi:hypothetical protein